MALGKVSFEKSLELERIAKGVQTEIAKITGQPKPKVTVIHVGGLKLDYTYEIFIHWGGGWFSNEWSKRTFNVRQHFFKIVNKKYTDIGVTEGGFSNAKSVVEIDGEQTEEYLRNQRLGENK